MDSLFQSIFKVEGGFEDLIINLEHQSSHISLDKLKDINIYSILASYFLACPVVSIVLTDFESYDKSMKEYKADEDLILKPRYIYFTDDEISKKINNLKAKHDLNEDLSDMEAIDLAFLPIMVPKHMRKKITRKLVNLFNGLIIKNETLNALLSHVLNLMLKYLFKGDELIELKGMIKMGFDESSDRILDARINEFNELNKKYYQSQSLLDAKTNEFNELNKKIQKSEKKLNESEEKLQKSEKKLNESEEKLQKSEKKLNESEEKLQKSEKNLKIANKERDEALSKAKHFIEAFKNLKKQGKLTDKDLALAGVIL